MRNILITTVMLMSGVPIFAQSVPSEVHVQDPAALVSKQREMVSQPVLSSGNPSRTAAEVPPDTPVVTLEGVCDKPALPGSTFCKTVITRARIDSLIDVLAPEATPAARRRFAISYARLLAASGVAQIQQLEKDPAVASDLQAQLELVRLQVLSNSLFHQMEKRAADIPMSEIQSYYMAHKADYQEGDVLRLAVPKAALTVSGQPEGAVKAKMDELVARAAAGADFDQLQQDAYKIVGIDSPLPPTKLSTVRRTNLLPGEGKVFDLNVGEVTEILDSPDSFVIVKLASKHTLPIEFVQPEIKASLQQERMAQELQNAAKNVKADFNLAYLDIPAAPELFIPSAIAKPSAANGVAAELRTPTRHRKLLSSQGLKGLPQPR
jgi:hypothetical protein